MKKKVMLLFVCSQMAVGSFQAQVVQGLKLPQLTAVQRDQIQKQGEPNNLYAEGQFIYNLDSNCLEYWNGAEWVSLCDKTTDDLPMPECKVKSTLTAPPYNGWLTFMCYNLGADSTMTIEQQMAYTPTGDTDATVYGDFYQWGRGTDGHEKRTSGTTTTLATTDTPGHSNFITPPSNPRDWRSPQNSNLWQPSTKINNPCPAGWRVPTQAEWSSIFAGGFISGVPTVATANKWTWNSSGTAGYMISPDNGTTTTLFLPAGGFRQYNSTFLGVGTGGCYWVSTVSGLYSYDLNFESSTVSPDNFEYFRGIGLSVRCVKDI